VSDWERLFTRPGGTVAAFATARAESGRVLVLAATAAGVYTSADAGRAWCRPAAGESVPFNEAIGVSRDQTIYAGGRNGLYRFDEKGKTWQPILLGARVLTLAAGGDVLLVGTEQDGVLRSEDGGRTFAGANAGLLDLTVMALALSPDFQRDSTAFLASASGVYRTRNAGKSWRPVDVDAAVQCLYVSPMFTWDGLVLAGTESEGLLRSDDAGAHWEPVSEFPATSITAIARSNPSGMIAVATDHGIALCDNGSTAWRITGADIGPVLALTFASDVAGEVLLAGLHRNGVARSAEPFDGWRLSNDGLQARLLLDLDLSPSFGSNLTMFTAGPDEGVLISRDAGRTWTVHLTGSEDSPVSGITVSTDSLFAATEAGLLRSRDAGGTWSVAIEDGAPVAVTAAKGRIVVALAEGRLLESTDNGETWRGLGAHFDRELISMACAPDGTLFVGTRADDELIVWRCGAGGSERERWLVEVGGDLLVVAVSPNYDIDETVYVGSGSRVLSPMRNTREVRSGERRPMWRAVDLGATITALATPSDAQHHRVVFAATSAGVYVSRDSGESFALWRDGGGPEAAVALAVSPNYARDGLVYALEIGGTIWCRRDPN
jgi:photosystem II stability/assembly factor-like uncharacterized protein